MHPIDGQIRRQRTVPPKLVIPVVRRWFHSIRQRVSAVVPLLTQRPSLPFVSSQANIGKFANMRLPRKKCAHKHSCVERAGHSGRMERSGGHLARRNLNGRIRHLHYRHMDCQKTR